MNPIRIPIGTLPSREQFDIAFIEVTGPSRTFAFKGMSFFAALLWMTLIDRLSISNMPEKHVEPAEAQAARLWCSEVLTALGFKWIEYGDEPDPHKEVLVTFRLPINADKEDGYRYLEMLVYGPMNYVGVYCRQTWDIISLDDMDFDDDGDGCPKPGKDYVKTTTAWEQICYHDSGWRTDGIDRIIRMYEDQILGLRGPRWYQVIDAPQEIQSKY